MASHSWSFAWVNRIPKNKKWDHAERLCYFPADSQPAALLPRCACISMLKPTSAGYSSAVFCWLPYESNSVVQPLDAIERLTLCFYTAMESPDRETLWGELSISTQQRVGFSQFMCRQSNTVQRSHRSVEWLCFIDTLFLDICFSQTARVVSHWVCKLSIFNQFPSVQFVKIFFFLCFICRLHHWMCVSSFKLVKTLILSAMLCTFFFHTFKRWKFFSLEGDRMNFSSGTRCNDAQGRNSVNV